MKQRIDAETDRQQAGELWTVADILMGLRYSEATAASLLSGVTTMQESVTYHGILRKGEAHGIVPGEQRGIAPGEQRGIALGEQRGRVAGARDALIQVLTVRVGSPPPVVLAI